MGINESDPLSMLELRDDWPDPIAPEGHTLVRVARDVDQHARPVVDAWSRRARRSVPDGASAVTSPGGTRSGNEVVVSGSFGNPDAGHGDESFDPDRALVSERFPGSFAEYTIVPDRNLVPEAGVHDDGGGRVHHRGVDHRVPHAVHPRPRRAGRDGADPGSRRWRGHRCSRAGSALPGCGSSSPAARPRSVDRALELGAHEAVETGARLSAPADLVIETVGEATWNHSLRNVRPGGRIVVSGATTGANPSADLARVFYRQISIIGVSGASRVETEQLLRFMEAADLHPVIDSVYPFDRDPRSVRAGPAT